MDSTDPLEPRRLPLDKVGRHHHELGEPCLPSCPPLSFSQPSRPCPDRHGVAPAPTSALRNACGCVVAVALSWVLLAALTALVVWVWGLL